jgi:hypothetical protein
MSPALDPYSERAVDPKVSVDPESSAIIIPFPMRNKPARKPVEPARAPVVSPKVVRLMRAPRRPGLERSGSGVMGRGGGAEGGS